MIYPSIRIEGAILSPDVLDRLEDVAGQRPADFGLEGTAKVKDEIARAWADAQDYWRIFQRKLESVRADSPATTETRQQWVLPLLGLLGYQLDFQPKSAEVNGKLYPLSHRVANRGGTVVHVTGYRDPAGLDRKAEQRSGALRMSAHAMVQEYLNLADELYGLVTNGRVLRLLRDSSRLIKLTYLEFDLDRIFSDGLFADFAILYRLLHATRLPVNREEAAQSWIERYHQDSLDAGSRIREGLSKAVEQAILGLANGFLKHKENDVLRQRVAEARLSAEDFYKEVLRLIYRLLFLMVIEERGLVFPSGTAARHREIYEQFYSVMRLRRMSERRHLADRRHADLWPALQATFRLFEAGGPGPKMGVPPLAGDLFRPLAIDALVRCTLGNDSLLGALRALNLYTHPDNGQLIRVNYGALNVEEFGSVYEGLLEYEPVILPDGAQTTFAFKRGDERANTGSHYTPDELVQPLIKHSLDHLIAERLKAKNPEAALLSLRVADVACGSGHILLAAARRIGQELAIVRTGEGWSSPLAMRTAVRDAIRHCIYGVDLNPLAVELCKVALWLEAHVPGEPLSFLDHHIKCGNAIVGYVRREDIEARGVPDEAFVKMPGDDREVVALLRQQNRAERAGQKALKFDPEVERQLDEALRGWKGLDALPEHTPEQVEAKRRRFELLSTSVEALRMEQLAAIPIAQFYIPKVKNRLGMHVTEEEFRHYWNDERQPQSQATAEAWAVAERKRFFHWFLGFPEVLAQGGFDCVLGNPPYLGNRALSGRYGDAFLQLMKVAFAPAGSVDLVTYFVRRIYELLRPGGYLALISTKTIAQGGAREGGLEVILKQGGTITFAAHPVRWPGAAAVDVALVGLHKGKWGATPTLNGKSVDVVNAFLEAAEQATPALELSAQADQSFIGSYVLGGGFILKDDEARQLLQSDPANAEVVLPYLIGDDLNSRPDQSPSRWVINFFDWEAEYCEERFPGPFEILRERVMPERTRRDEHGEFVLRRPLPQRWWIYADKRPKLYRLAKGLKRVLVINRHTKNLAFSFYRTGVVYSDATVVVVSEKWEDYATLNSCFHEAWAWKQGSTMGAGTLRYTPSSVFETFPTPDCRSERASELVAVGSAFDKKRVELMLQLWVGLTEIYNLLHARDLSPELVARTSKKAADVARSGFDGLLELRRLRVALDNAVRDAYGWMDLTLGHDFVEVETLPESDRVRYTISSTARKEVLKRLLALNHERARQEAAQAQMPEKGKTKRVAAKRTAAVTPPSAPVGVPAFATISAEVAALPDAAWASASGEPAANDALALAAVLKAFAVPAATQHARLAALLCVEPRLFTRLAPQPLAAQWKRLNGSQAAALPPGVSSLAPAARTSFGIAVKAMRARGVLVEDMILDTWGPGPGLEAYDTSGWANGRARWVVSWLRAQDLNALLQGLPAELASFVDEQAA
jgi:methylase of polypeptide subunit release factors